MIKRSGTPYESFKNDRDRLWALVSRDVRIVLVAAILAGAGFASAPPALRSMIAGWIV